MRRFASLGVVVASLFVVGCADKQNPTQANSGELPRSTSSEVNGARSDNRATGGEALAVPLEIKSWTAIQEWVARQRGKVVVIDVWSTFCHPCLKEFPHFVELHQRYGDRIACASLNVDFYGGAGDSPEDVQPRVFSFLTERRATMPNFISRDSDETILRHFDVASIPMSLVYDRDGLLRTAFNNDKGTYGPEGFNYADDIVPLVEKLLQSGG